MLHSLWPLWTAPARLLCPWDSPGKNTGVGCHFLLQGSSLPRDLPDPGIFLIQRSSQPRDRTHISMSPALADRFLVLPEKSKFKRQWEENVWRHQGLGGERYFWKYQAIYFHRQGRVHMRAGVWPWHSGQFIMTHYPKAFTDWTCIFIFPVF